MEGAGLKGSTVEAPKWASEADRLNTSNGEGSVSRWPREWTTIRGVRVSWDLKHLGTIATLRPEGKERVSLKIEPQLRCGQNTSNRLENKCRMASEMAQQVGSVVTKSANLSSVPRTHVLDNAIDKQNRGGC